MVTRTYASHTCHGFDQENASPPTLHKTLLKCTVDQGKVQAQLTEWE